MTGLQKAMDLYLSSLSFNQEEALKTFKLRGKGLFAPERGGSYEVFKARPMHPDLIIYAALDVYYLDPLYVRLFSTLSPVMKGRVKTLTEDRLRVYLKKDYSPSGPSMAIAPSF